jgi:beta-galactosidase
MFPCTALSGINRALAEETGVPATDTSPSIAPREHLLFDFDWQFFQGNAADPARDLGFGKDQGDFSKSGEFAFATAKFDDSKWRSLNLPHDWAVELPFVHDDALQSHGYKPLAGAIPKPAWGGIDVCLRFLRKTLGVEYGSNSTASFAARWSS